MVDSKKVKTEITISEVPKGRGFMGMALVDGTLTNGTRFHVSLTGGGWLNVLLEGKEVGHVNYLVSFDGIIDAVREQALKKVTRAQKDAERKATRFGRCRLCKTPLDKIGVMICTSCFESEN